ncbi:MAG TPA: phosphoserine phosphatase SerB, partial [Rhizomicrobium sp.]|nr:phosphoserine phosphatase SerB [Rhizomicrobium sp.]
SHEAVALAGPLRALAAERGVAVGEIDWLAPRRAFDLPFLDRPVAVLSAARAMAGEVVADINLVPAANRRKKLLIADMDSTIIDCEVLDELADMAGLREKVAPVTEAAMRGEIAFEPALRQRAAFLAGLPVSLLDRVYRECVRLNPGARELVATMRAHGARTMLVSGGFAYFTQRVAEACGFDSEQANELLHSGGMFTGKVREPILGRDAKLRALEQAIAEMSISLADTLAVGDGANDLAMIEAAGLGVAFRAKPILADAADAVIDLADLTALLYLQGYREAEIADA